MKRSIFVSIVAVAVMTFGRWLFYGQSQDIDQIDGASIVSVIVPNHTSNLQDGKNLYDSKCSRCHELNAAGENGNDPPEIHKIYEQNHHGDGSFVLAAKNGVRSHHWPFGSMPPVEGITDTETYEIIEYVRHLQRANGIGLTN